DFHVTGVQTCALPISDDHLEGTRPQDQPDARGKEYANGNGDDGFHQFFSCPVASAASMAATGRRWLRSDWCARAVSISMVAPTTTLNTPRSKKKALGRCSSPSSGSSKWAV